MNAKNLTVVIEHAEKMVLPDAVIAAIKDTVLILQGIDRSLSEEADLTARWAIVDIRMQSPLHMTFAPIPTRANRPIRDSIAPFLEDMNRLENGERPRILTPGLQQRAREMLQAIGKANAKIRFTSNGMEANLSAHLIANVDALCHRYVEVGSVEGSLDVIDVHGAEKVRVWDARFNCPVDCRVSQIQVQEAKDYLGWQVAVRGRVRYEHHRPREVIDVFDIRKLGNRATLPQMEDIAPLDLTGGVEPADYLRGDEE